MYNNSIPHGNVSGSYATIPEPTAGTSPSNGAPTSRPGSPSEASSGPSAHLNRSAGSTARHILAHTPTRAPSPPPLPLELAHVGADVLKDGLGEIMGEALDPARQEVAEGIYNDMQFHDRGEMPPGAFFRADSNGDAKGLLTMFKHDNAETGKQQWIIHSLVSLKGSRSGGQLAQQAIKHAIDDMGAEGKDQLTLTSLNDASTAFWKEQGFEQHLPDSKSMYYKGAVPAVLARDACG